MRTALWDLTVLPQKLPNVNDQRKRSKNIKCALPIFLAQHQPQALFRRSAVWCVYLVTLVHFSHLKPCMCFATAGAVSRGLQQLSNVQRVSSFCLCGICCPCLFLIHPSRAIQTFRVFSFIFPTLSSLNQGVLTCIFILDVGTIPCLWLSLSPFSGFPVLLYPLNKGEPNLLTLFKMQVAVYWLVI